MGQFCQDADGAEIDSMRYFEDDAGWRELRLRNRLAPFRFTCCGEALFLSRSRANVPFFSHKPYSPCVGSAKDPTEADHGIALETIEHWTLKHLAAHMSRSLGWQADVEVSCSDPATEGGAEPQAWRANCLASQDDRRVVFEILASRQSETDTVSRARMFKARGILCVWLTTDEANILVDSAIPLYLVEARNGSTLRSTMERCRRPCSDGESSTHRPDYDALAEALVARWPVARPHGQTPASFGKTTPIRDIFSLAFDNPSELSAEARRHEDEQAQRRFAAMHADYALSAPQPPQRARSPSAPLERRDISSREVAYTSIPVAREVASDLERCADDLQRLCVGVGDGRSDALPLSYPRMGDGHRVAEAPSGDVVVQIYATATGRAGQPRAITRLSLHRLRPDRFLIPQGMPYTDPIGDVTFTPQDQVGVSDLLRWFPVFGVASCAELVPGHMPKDPGEVFVVRLHISAPAMRAIQWAEASSLAQTHAMVAA